MQGREGERDEEGEEWQSVVRRIADMQPAEAAAAPPRISLARMPERGLEIYVDGAARMKRTMRREEGGREGRIRSVGRSVRGN